MNDLEPSTTSNPPSGEGFRISDEPVVRAKGVPGNGAFSGASHDADLLYVIARDPKSLFIYWDLNWKRAFARAGLSARQVHLRVYRQDGSAETTLEINPFRGHCYADVAAAGADYHCELGCFESDEWRSLVRSGRAATPAERMSDDLSAQFATLPLHLSFQRMLDILRVTQAEGTRLAQTVASLQEKARATGGNGQARNGANGAPVSDLHLLLQAPDAVTPSPEERAQWTKLVAELGGRRWGGSSGNGFGGSSPV